MEKPPMDVLKQKDGQASQKFLIYLLVLLAYETCLYICLHIILHLWLIMATFNEPQGACGLGGLHIMCHDTHLRVLSKVPLSWHEYVAILGDEDIILQLVSPNLLYLGQSLQVLYHRNLSHSFSNMCKKSVLYLCFESLYFNNC